MFMRGLRSATFRRMLAEVIPNGKKERKRPKIDRNRRETDQKLTALLEYHAASVLAKCRSTSPKIRHKPRGETLASYLQG